MLVIMTFMPMCVLHSTYFFNEQRSRDGTAKRVNSSGVEISNVRKSMYVTPYNNIH